MKACQHTAITLQTDNPYRLQDTSLYATYRATLLMEKTAIDTRDLCVLCLIQSHRSSRSSVQHIYFVFRESQPPSCFVTKTKYLDWGCISFCTCTVQFVEVTLRKWLSCLKVSLHFRALTLRNLKFSTYNCSTFESFAGGENQTTEDKSAKP